MLMNPFPKKYFIKVIFNITMIASSNSLQTEQRIILGTPDRVIPPILS